MSRGQSTFRQISDKPKWGAAVSRVVSTCSLTLAHLYRKLRDMWLDRVGLIEPGLTILLFGSPTVDLAKIAESADHVAKVIAVLIGGGWVYFKFLRGRTFARRVELGATGEVIRAGDQDAVKVTVTLRNAGLSQLPLQTAAVRLYATSTSQWSPGRNVQWDRQMITRIFTAHGWVEPQEAIVDQILLPVGNVLDRNWGAFRIETVILSESRQGLRHKATKWVTDTLVPADVTKSEEKAEPGVPADGDLTVRKAINRQH